MLLAEEFVLLALNPDGAVARGASNQPSAAIGVTGALVAELALDGHLDLTDGRIRLTGTRPADPLLAQALDNVAPHEGRKLKSRLGSIKHAGWSEVVDAMVASGTLGREKEALHRPATRFGIQRPTTRSWPACGRPPRATNGSTPERRCCWRCPVRARCWRSSLPPAPIGPRRSSASPRPRSRSLPLTRSSTSSRRRRPPSSPARPSSS